MKDKSKSRREFLSAAAMAAIGATTGARAYMDSQDNVFGKAVDNGSGHVEKPFNRSLTKPPALKKGDLVAITAPASPTSQWEMRHCLKALKRQGYKLEIGKTITDRKSRDRYLSAPDEMRAEEFMSFARRDDVRCILCGRGGYGVMRILDLLDYNEIIAHPKPIIGFSDITALLLAIYTKTGIVTFHGPVAATNFNSFTTKHLLDIIAADRQFEPVRVDYSTMRILNEGEAAGKLVGGNLSLLVSSLGTPYEIETKDSILFFEDVSEHPYKIDKMLTHLKLAGKFDDANAIAIGYFKGLNSRRPFYPGGSFTIKQVLDQIIKPLNKPTVYGMPIGHVSNKLTLPLGISAALNATKNVFTIAEQAVDV